MGEYLMICKFGYLKCWEWIENIWLFSVILNWLFEGTQGAQKNIRDYRGGA